MHAQLDHGLRRLALYWQVLMIGLFSLFPTAWMLTTALKRPDETFTSPLRWIDFSPTLDNFARMWTIQPFARYFLNSAIVSVSTTAVAVVVAILAGYGFSRFRFRGDRLCMFLILITQLFPGVLLIIPYFMVASAWGLFNTYAGLILAYVSFALPFCVWMLKGFFDSIPRELDEAALVDGCSRFRAFLRVVLPGAAPGIGATALFSFFLAWTEFLFALCLTSSQSMFPVTVGIASNIGQYRILWNELMASALMSSLPAIVVFLALERHFVAVLTSGAVKG